jgi:hypothetical protein
MAMSDICNKGFQEALGGLTRLCIMGGQGMRVESREHMVGYRWGLGVMVVRAELG